MLPERRRNILEDAHRVEFEHLAGVRHDGYRLIRQEAIGFRSGGANAENAVRQDQLAVLVMRLQFVLRERYAAVGLVLLVVSRRKCECLAWDRRANLHLEVLAIDDE